MEYRGKGIVNKKIETFKDLYVWQEGHKLVLMIYRLTRKFPNDEKFGLVSQMRRCAVSITSNVAEGFSRQSYKEKVQFYSISMGSLTELENQCIISKDVGCLSIHEFINLESQINVVGKLLRGLIKTSQTHIQYS